MNYPAQSKFPCATWKVTFDSLHFILNKNNIVHKQCLVILVIRLFVLFVRKMFSVSQTLQHSSEIKEISWELKWTRKFWVISLYIDWNDESLSEARLSILSKNWIFGRINFLHCSFMKLFMSICSILLSCHFS